MKSTAIVEADPVMPDASAVILGALPHPVVLLGTDGRVLYANPAAEQFFQAGASYLLRHAISDLVPFGSPVLPLIEQALNENRAISEYDVDLGTPRTGPNPTDIQVAPVAELPGCVILSLLGHSIAHSMDRQLTHRGAARAVVGMATVLAHEIKNPLSGIRGAAQILEQELPENDRTLARLIRDETDRICDLVNSMEFFSDERPIDREPVNIHMVLERVRTLAASGFARRVRITERYDPSLPYVSGNRDQLIQVFLNLVKNAAEAAPDDGGEIVLTTAYRHGLRLAVGSARDRVHLPLEVTVLDNGGGVPEDMLPHLFDPFVTSKPGGSGLGLALVAKVINDHGGTIECESQPKRTVFKVRLPIDGSAQEGGE